ncbi:MAG: type II toxin-antitoxin system YafQ family toxin [Oscillospiraceae bacterium]|nr:type II toxin-antitoxin system YafQ family toxin [Oscillospiraceae bacterium]
MLKLNTSTRFRRDLKLCAKRGYDLSLLQTVIDVLRIPAALPPRNREHGLTGDLAGCRECHILPDWLLIYRVEGDDLYLVRTGTHSDLLGL